MPFAEVAERLTLGCRVLAEQDIVDGYGHLSARHPDHRELFVISRAMSPALVEPSDFIVMDFDGKVIEGSGFPNQEWPIHACIYRARADVGSVLHSHSPLSRVWSLSPVKLRGVLMGQSYDWNDGLPVYRDAGLIRNLERGQKLVATLGSGSAMLLRGHGDVVVDADVTRNVMRSITLKQNAAALHMVLAHGTPDYWSIDEAKPWVEPMSPDVSREAAAGLAARAFDYYVARVDGRLAKRLHPESAR